MGCGVRKNAEKVIFYAWFLAVLYAYFNAFIFYYNELHNFSVITICLKSVVDY